MGKRKKLLKQLRKRDLDDGTPSLVICVGKKCCAREKSRAVLDSARTYVAESGVENVRVVPVSCLDICKKGPIIASYPDRTFEKKATADDAREMIDELAREATADDSDTSEPPPSEQAL